MDKEKQTQYEAGATLLNEGIKFKVPFIFGRNITLSVKPLHPGTIVKISQQSTKIKEVGESDHLINELMNTGDNLYIFCKIIALGVLNGYFSIKLFTGIMAQFLMWKLPSTTEVFAYSSLVYRQMGAEHFFFTMTLAKGMNFLKKRETESTGEATHYGVHSQ